MTRADLMGQEFLNYLKPRFPPHQRPHMRLSSFSGINDSLVARIGVTVVSPDDQFPLFDSGLIKELSARVKESSKSRSIEDKFQNVECSLLMLKEKTKNV